MRSVKVLSAVFLTMLTLAGCSNVNIKDGGLVEDFTVNKISVDKVPAGMLESLEPALVVKDNTTVNVVLYGSGSCEPFIEKVVDSGSQVAFIVKNYGNMPCTMDYRGLPMSVKFNGSGDFDFHKKTFTACSQGACLPVKVLGVETF